MAKPRQQIKIPTLACYNKKQIMPPSHPTPAPSPHPSPVPGMPSLPVAAQDREYIEVDECLVTVVHRHPIGIIIIYLEALVFIVALVVLGSFVFPDLFNGSGGGNQALLTASLLLAVGLIALVMFVATYIYRQNRILVTDRSLVQVMQKGLFARKVSRLSMSNVEDVSATHHGILSTIFNYGILHIQTAGERENFVFPWCPEPDNYADRILDARQAYAHRLEEDKEP